MNNTVLEALPSLSEDYPLTSEQIQEYQERGHVLLPHLISQAEIDAYRPYILEAVEREQNSNRLTAINPPSNWIFINNLWSLDRVASRFIQAPRFAKVAAQLLNVDGVRLCRDQVMFKKPKGLSTPWHQHSPSLPLSPGNNVSLWINLVDVTSQMSMMIFADGTHKPQKFLGVSSLHQDEMEEFAKFLFDQGYPLSGCRYYMAGDAEFIDGWTLHSAMEHKGDRTRESLVILYYPEGTRISFSKELAPDASVVEQMNKDRSQQVLQSCFPGLTSGDLAVTPMNPLVYSRQWDEGGKSC